MPAQAQPVAVGVVLQSALDLALHGRRQPRGRHDLQPEAHLLFSSLRLVMVSPSFGRRFRNVKWRLHGALRHRLGLRVCGLRLNRRALVDGGFVDAARCETRGQQTVDGRAVLASHVRH